MRADAWSAYGEDDILYCSECWLDSDPDLVQCEECLEWEADGATGIVYNAGIGAMGFLSVPTALARSLTRSAVPSAVCGLCLIMRSVAARATVSTAMMTGFSQRGR